MGSEEAAIRLGKAADGSCGRGGTGGSKRPGLGLVDELACGAGSQGCKGLEREGPKACAFGPVVHLERVTGIEPALRAWKARILPLNYTRVAVGL